MADNDDDKPFKTCREKAKMYPTSGKSISPSFRNVAAFNNMLINQRDQPGMGDLRF